MNQHHETRGRSVKGIYRLPARSYVQRQLAQNLELRWIPLASGVMVNVRVGATRATVWGRRCGRAPRHAAGWKSTVVLIADAVTHPSQTRAIREPNARWNGHEPID